jgi:hypothetical protein
MLYPLYPCIYGWLIVDVYGNHIPNDSHEVFFTTNTETYPSGILGRCERAPMWTLGGE